MFYFKDDNQLTVYFADGNSAVWQNSNPQFGKVLDLCQSNNWIKIEMLHNQAKTLLNNKAYIQDNNLIIEKEQSTVTIGLKDSPNEECKDVISFIKLLKNKGVIDTEIESIKPFLKNMFKNPFIDAVHEIYEYCKAMDFEITEDGCFLAYKYVNKDLTSCYDNTTKHAIGKYTEVSVFDTNRRNECSQGLHFCAKSYLDCCSSNTIIIVKVNPKDVVSIPLDYDFAKGRCKRYMMVGYLAPNGTLQTTNLEEATNEKIVKTTSKIRLDKKVSQKKSNRIDETVQNMNIYNNDVNKVAKVMNLNVETVKRNIRKYKQRHKR